jgi:ABC-type Fe3+-siderophore transport system permease subunit
LATGESDSRHSPEIAIFALVFLILILPWSPFGVTGIFAILQPLLVVLLIYLVVKWMVRREVRRELGRQAGKI